MKTDHAEGKKVESHKFTELKYKIAWGIGSLLSCVLYYSGIVFLHAYFRKKYSRNRMMIVLTYHRIHDNRNDAHISVSTNNFIDQMKYLKKKFQVIPIESLIKRLKSTDDFREDVVSITFDDGWKDNYTNAYPVLQKYQIPAAIFVVADFISSKHGLSRGNIIQMQNNGITIGVHTSTHKVLSGVDREEAFNEISESKLVLEEILEKEVRYFAYPYGKKGKDFNEETMQIVSEIGFEAAFSTNNGSITRESDFFALERIGIRNLPMFVFKVRVSGIFESKLVLVFRKILGL